MPVRPVRAYAVGITPAATVIGAIDAKMNASTASMPSLSRASARDTVPARAGAACMDMKKPPGCSSDFSGAVGQDGGGDGDLGLGDQLPQGRRQVRNDIGGTAAGLGLVLVQPEAQPG